jgi:hypothetical protein
VKCSTEEDYMNRTVNIKTVRYILVFPPVFALKLLLYNCGIFTDSDKGRFSLYDGVSKSFRTGRLSENYK